MAFCSKCGAQMNDDAQFCASCGAPRAGAQNNNGAQGQQNSQAQYDFTSKISELNNTSDTTSEFDPADIEANKTMAVLSYLSWLVLIPLLAAQNSKFARYHANQGLVLAIIEIVWGIATSIIGAIPIFGWIISIPLGIVSLVFLVLTVLGIVNAANGRAKELPIIGKIRIIK